MTKKLTYFFDVDDTTVKGQFFTNAYEEKYGVHIDLSFFKTSHWQDAINGKISDTEVINMMADEWKIAETLGSSEAIAKFWYETENNPDPQMIALVKQLRKSGHKVVVATNQNTGRASYIWNEMGFKDIFDGMAVSSKIGDQKPNPAFYEGALKVAEEEDPQNAVLIDDKQSSVDGALAAGWKAIQFKDVKSLIQEIAKLETT